MVRVSIVVGLFYSVQGAGTTCAEDGTCAGADETTLLHINQLEVEGDSMNTVGNSNGWFGIAAKVDNEGNRDCGSSWMFLLNNGRCNDGTRNDGGPSHQRNACRVGTDCVDCNNCAGPVVTTQPPPTQPPTTQPPTTQPPTTPPPVYHPNHVQGDTHSNSCPSHSSTIGSDAECHGAATAVGLDYGGTQDESGRPGGCYSMHHEHASKHVVYFNSNAGAGHSHGSPLCAKLCNAATDCNGHGTTHDDNKINGCRCECDVGFGGDDCATPVCIAAQQCSGHGTTTEGQDATNGCVCTCESPSFGILRHGWHGDNCAIPPECHSDHHCNGHATVDTDSSDGCACSCADGWSGNDCTIAPPATTTPIPGIGNPTVITCDSTVEFVLEPRETWKAKVDAPPGTKVLLSTCDGPAGTDTVIDKPCYNDDANGACGYKSRCDYTQTEATPDAEIKFYGSNSGPGILKVTCEQGEPPAPANPAVIECGQEYEFLLDRGELWTPKLRATKGQTADFSTCGAPGGEDTVIEKPCKNDDGPRPCGVMSKCSKLITEDAETDAEIRFYSRSKDGQRSTLTVTCSGGPNACDAAVDCNGHGTTNDNDRTDNGCDCECNGGFTGDNCGIAPVCDATQHCSGHGSTDDLDSSNGCDCTCSHEFHGVDCSVPPSCHKDTHCNGHATLDADSTDGCVCNCADGWSGSDCTTIPACNNEDDCSGHGITDDSDKLNGCLCMCTQDFTGHDCATPPICDFMKHCSGHGSTIDVDSTNGCDCTCLDEGQGFFRGDDCSIPPACDSTHHCNGHATLDINATDGCDCHCTFGWTGSDCKTPPEGDGPTQTPAPQTTQPTTQQTTTTQAPPPPDNGDAARHGYACTNDHERQVTPPSLSGGCQRCTCVSGQWQCACSMRHRKEMNDVSDVEFDLFAKSINQMKKSGMWVTISKVHAASEKQHYSTHGDPRTFLPWHRKFFVEVENRLQMAAVETGATHLEACTVTIPYWNWALEEDFPQSVTFASNRLGALTNSVDEGDLDAQFCVKDGQFGTEVASSEFGAGNNPFNAENFMQEGCSQRWGQNACSEFISALNSGDGSDCIFRKGNSQIFGQRQTLTYAQIITALREHDSYKGIDNYVAMANFIEREIHNSLHGAVGGYRSAPGTRRRTERRYGHMTSFYSPYDPIFFLHHGFIDFLWSQWQDVHVTGEWRANHNAGDMLNNLLFDGGTDQFPVTDVNMAMDIKDDDPGTQEREENVCVKYHERQTNHPCAPPDEPDKWTRIQTCFSNLATYEKLHTVPRIKYFTSVGDVCDPLNKLHFDSDRMWLETMVQAGMMQEDHIQTVLDWERDQLHSIDRTTEVIDIGDGNSTSQCDKALCFSATTMLGICDACDSKGWALDCHCSVSSQGLEGTGQSCWESRT